MCGIGDKATLRVNGRGNARKQIVNGADKRADLTGQVVGWYGMQLGVLSLINLLRKAGDWPEDPSHEPPDHNEQDRHKCH
ncbi:hypothetical protein [Pandoraea sp. NE5]|uniref:hypothetical protein n=1 Tax=Pandoraea sp. NE5 TaxID=2904129 RepID=UPI0029056C0D|nr:hypothetical protein [Pandoraea sp. NE5]